MKLIEILEPDFSFKDDRGTLVQITHQPYVQTNAVFSYKGQIRGEYHYHQYSKEIFYIISGKVKVQLKFKNQYEEHCFNTGDMFSITENVRHRFEYKEDTYLVVFYTSRVEREDGTKDIVTE